MATVNEVFSDASSYGEAQTPKGFNAHANSSGRNGRSGMDHSTSDVYSRNDKLQLTPKGPNQNPLHVDNRPAALRTSGISGASVPISNKRPSPANANGKQKRPSGSQYGGGVAQAVANANRLSKSKKAAKKK